MPDKHWIRTPEGRDEYKREFGRSIPEALGELVGLASDPEGAVTSSADFVRREYARANALGAEEYVRRVARAAGKAAKTAYEDPEAAADATSTLLETILAKKAPILKAMKEDDLIVAAKAAEGAFGDVGDRNELPLEEELRAQSYERQLKALDPSRKTAELSRMGRRVDSWVNAFLAKRVLQPAVNSPVIRRSALFPAVNDAYRASLDNAEYFKFLARVGTEDEKKGDSARLAVLRAQYLPSEPDEPTMTAQTP